MNNWFLYHHVVHSCKLWKGSRSCCYSRWNCSPISGKQSCYRPCRSFGGIEVCSFISFIFWRHFFIGGPKIVGFWCVSPGISHWLQHTCHHNWAQSTILWHIDPSFFFRFHWRNTGNRAGLLKQIQDSCGGKVRLSRSMRKNTGGKTEHWRKGQKKPPKKTASH